MNVQRDDKVKVDTSEILELLNFDHRTFGVMMGVLDYMGGGEEVQRILEGLKGLPIGKSGLFYYEQTKKALGIE